MSLQNEVRDFLTARRASITPGQAGLPTIGHRRVAGLRREEVAQLAGVSVDYYNRLERGNLQGVSVSVLDSIARALRLDEADRTHLRNLSAATNSAPFDRRSASSGTIRRGLQQLIDAMTETAAGILNGRMDLLATNRLGAALFHDAGHPSNLARFVFLDPRARRFYVDWEASADDTVAILRSSAGKEPHDRDLSDLIGELATRSEEFSTKWAAHRVRFHRTGSKSFHHRVVGDLTLSFEALDLATDPGLALLAYTAEPGSTSYDAFRMLASWAATEEQDARTHHDIEP